MQRPIENTPRSAALPATGSALGVAYIETGSAPVSTQAHSFLRPGESMPISVFLADDHSIVREGLRTLIEAQSGMTVVGEATDGAEAWHGVRTMAAQGVAPDVVIMDVSMPGMGGVEATAKIHESLPTIKILVLSMHEDRSYLRSLLEAGAAGYVLKRSAATELVRAIQTVVSGGVYLDPALAATVARSFVEDGRSMRTTRSTAPPTLSEREESVMRLIAQGYANKEIAAQLHLSVKTVETYKARSMEKLELDSRVDLIRYALAQGWLQ